VGLGGGGLRDGPTPTLALLMMSGSGPRVLGRSGGGLVGTSLGLAMICPGGVGCGCLAPPLGNPPGGNKTLPSLTAICGLGKRAPGGPRLCSRRCRSLSCI
jgi:hypothetical protein